MLRQLLRPIVRNVSKRGSRGYHHDVANYKRPTLEDVPSPEGSWQQYYDSRQKSFNIQLGAGVVMLLGTIVYINQTGAIFFNWGPPTPKEEK